MQQTGTVQCANFISECFMKRIFLYNFKAKIDLWHIRLDTSLKSYFYNFAVPQFTMEDPGSSVSIVS